MSFNGFSPETIKFLTELAINNNKTWFEAHRKDYDGFLMQPARAVGIQNSVKRT
jgi:uncharacterized protein (DUF2461 family)